tara:strand:- start:1150 stop:1416 length:267 start_codon:yes stop_codon:yes gene_type:complete
MERGSGNKVRNRYTKRSPAKAIITSLVMAALSAAKGSMDKSNQKSKEAASKIGKGDKGIKLPGIEQGSGMGEAKAAMAPMKGGLKNKK